MNTNVKKLSVSSMFLALCIVLPFLTANNMQLGNALCLMHIPVFLCGFVCGPFWGMAIGLIAPLLRSFITGGMPPLIPTALAMAFELAAYGFISGLLYKIFPKKNLYIYTSLISAMICGRAVWGLVTKLIVTSGLTDGQFTLAIFWTKGFVNALPGITIHILLIPILIMALRRAKLIPIDKNSEKI
jgi:thiamine transporter ThiT